VLARCAQRLQRLGEQRRSADSAEIRRREQTVLGLPRARGLELGYSQHASKHLHTKAAVQDRVPELGDRLRAVCYAADLDGRQPHVR